MIGKVTVYLEGAPIGHIRFKIQITASQATSGDLYASPWGARHGAAAVYWRHC